MHGIVRAIALFAEQFAYNHSYFLKCLPIETCARFYYWLLGIENESIPDQQGLSICAEYLFSANHPFAWIVLSLLKMAKDPRYH